MAPTVSLSPLKCNTLISFSPLFLSPNCKISSPRKLHRSTYAYDHSHPTFSYQNSSIPRNLFSLGPRETSLIAFDAKNSASGEADNEALDAVLRLYSAIKNKNYQELSDILADECRCVCNFLSFFQAFQGKTVGVQWRFEWKKIHVPLGKGFSFHICQTYQGKAVIRNIEMFMEPLLHFETLRLKMMGSLTAFTDKIGSLVTLDSKNKTIKILSIVLALLSIAPLLFFMLTP